MRRRWLAGIFAVSVIWAVLVAAFSSDSVHRLWGVMAAIGYGLALLAVLAVRNARASDVALGLSFVGGLLAPLTWMAARGLEQPEVWVVARSGSMLIHQGTPYASAAALAATTNPNAYNPYLPVMALFGLPRALFDGGLLTDPRIWFGVVFLVVFWLALRQGGARDPGRWAILVAGSPVIAFELAVGGTDVPMVGFLCLGFALLYRRPTSVNLAILAGLALGIASAMKATAWPALVVARRADRGPRRQEGGPGVHADRARRGRGLRRAVHRPSEVRWSTTRSSSRSGSPASSRPPRARCSGTSSRRPGTRPGTRSWWRSWSWPGRAVALSLVFRPPRTVPRAVVLLAGAMTLMFVLAPSTRFGYFIYPATLAIWLFAVRAGSQRADGLVTPDPDEPAASLRTSRPTIPAERPAA